MNDCCEGGPSASENHGYRRVLWIVLALNAGMFLAESVMGYLAGSTALQADAIDFLGDSLNYVSALYVLDKSLRWKSVAALVKGGVIAVFGAGVLANALYHWLYAAVPKAEMMGIVGFLALIINVSCAILLFRFRKGDSNRSSVWICSRNDAIASSIVIAAGIIVYYTESGLPDVFASVIIAFIALSGAVQIITKARCELRLA